MIRIRQIKLPIDKSNINNIKEECGKILNISPNKILNIKITKKSLDARKKPQLYFVFEVDISIEKEEYHLKKNKSPNILKTPNEKYIFKITGTKELKNRPIIIGAGPSGLFCAYMLAKHGYKPLIIERGEPVEERINTISNFWETGNLNPESNVQFGEGGAGTFSDGKLVSQVKDNDYRGKEVFHIFVDSGAPEEITYLNKPHIGTDLLRNIIINIRNKIINMGGEFIYNTKLIDLNIKDNKLEKIKLSNGNWYNTNILVLAIGHSARDTFEMLYNNKIIMESKPFAVGIRIQHPQNLINKNQYGQENNKLLEPASYKLTHKCQNGRGAYSFCMCPGGFVVNSSSEEKMLSINGMSNHQRNSENANSAIIVTITPKDYGNNPLDGIKFQRELEIKAYQVGKGNIPTQLFKDYKNNINSNKIGSINPIFKGKYTLTNLNPIFPEYINNSLKEAITSFDKNIKGFANDDAILSAVESRTSSPVRIIRNELGESNIQGIYPCGEGAGYAGGITSASIDGIKIAELIASIYKPIS